MNEFPTVLESIHNLANSLGGNYMRTGLKISLEPDAFYRLWNEVNGQKYMDPIDPEVYNRLSQFVIMTSIGPVQITRDESLGKSGYIKVWKHFHKN